MSDSVSDTVRTVLSAVLKLDIAPGDDVQREDHPVWDSLRHMEAIFAIEDALEIEFHQEEIAELDSLEKLTASARRHRAAQTLG